MSLAEYNATFCAMMRSGAGCEPWTHTNEDMKLTQFGWRCTNTENGYKPEVLVGNWNEEQFDISKMAVRKPLPSSTGHAYVSTYADSYHKGQPGKVPEILKHLKEREKFAFGGHQPEFDTQETKDFYNSFKTDYTSSYVNHGVQN